MFTGTSLKLKLAKTVPRGERLVDFTLTFTLPRTLDNSHQPPSLSPPPLNVSGIYLKRFFGQQVIYTLRPTGLCPSVVRLKPTSSCQPDGKVVADSLRWIAVNARSRRYRVRSQTPPRAIGGCRG